MSQRRLPAEIYWRRRLLALAVVIALVWVALRLTGAMGGSDDEPKAAPTTPAPTTAATTKTPVETTDGLVDVTLVGSTRDCDPQEVRVTPTVRPGQLTKAPVDIGLVVSSTSKRPCTLTPAVADDIAVISANGTAVWDSTVCKQGLIDKPIALSASWATVATVQWSGRGSGARCNSGEGYASPGTYTLQIGTLGGEPGRTTFKLAAKPAPQPSPTATKDTPTPSKSTPTPKPPKGTTKPADE